jgi:hypothetical protein
VPWSGVKACTKQTLEKGPLGSISPKTPEGHMKHTQSHADVLAGRVKATSKISQTPSKVSHSRSRSKPEPLQSLILELWKFLAVCPSMYKAFAKQ